MIGNTMAKFFGPVGYVTTSESPKGIFKEVAHEQNYFGDILRNTRRWDNGEYLNGNVVVNNLISIIADAYAYDHFFNIRYVFWQDVYWKVTNVEVQRPRLILTLGGVYNGNIAKPIATSEDSGGFVFGEDQSILSTSCEFGN